MQIGPFGSTFPNLSHRFRLPRILLKREKILANKKKPNYDMKSHQSVADIFLSKQASLLALNLFPNLGLCPPFSGHDRTQTWAYAHLPLAMTIPSISRSSIWLVNWSPRCDHPSPWPRLHSFQYHKADKLFMRGF